MVLENDYTSVLHRKLFATRTKIKPFNIFSTFIKMLSTYIL